MIGSVSIAKIQRSGGGGRERRIAKIRRKVLRQRVFLSEKDSGAVFVFEAVNEQRARRVIFEQRKIIRIDLRTGSEIPQARVVERIKTKKSRGLIHSKLLEIVMQRGVGIQSLRAIQNINCRSAGRHQNQVGPIAVPKRGTPKFRKESRQNHPQVLRIQRIGLEPLNERAAGRQAGMRGTIKLSRE